MTCTTAPGTGGAPLESAGAALQLVPLREQARRRPMLEREALETALARDLDGSFERLVAEYQDRLFGFALRLTRSREDAEEVAQDTFVRAYRAMKTYPAERVRALGLRPWLYQITLNVVRNRVRRKRHRLVSLEARAAGEDGRGAWEPEEDEARRPDSIFEARQRRADLATLVAGLPARYRTPLILRYVEDLRLEEVAAVLKQPIGTTKSNVHRGVNALRVAITESRRAKR